MIIGYRTGTRWISSWIIPVRSKLPINGLIQCVSNSIYLPATSLGVFESNLKQHWWFSRTGKLSWVAHIWLPCFTFLCGSIECSIENLLVLYSTKVRSLKRSTKNLKMLLESWKSFAWAWFHSNLKIWKKGLVLSPIFPKFLKGIQTRLAKSF